jgi:hypothetical protein
MNKEFSMESFINWCDEMKICNEKLDTRILDLNFGKTMTLYHGTKRRIDGPIKPTSYNAGNRLRGESTSSYWAKTYDYAAFWATSWACNVLGVSECLNISHKKIVLPGHYVNKEGVSLIDVFREEYKKNPFFVYEANVDIKHIGRGQAAINEYTVDIAVKPEKVYVLSWNEIQKYIIYTKNSAEYEAYKQKFTVRKSFTKNKLNLREKLIFKDHDTTVDMRNKYFSNIYSDTKPIKIINDDEIVYKAICKSMSMMNDYLTLQCNASSIDDKTSRITNNTLNMHISQIKQMSPDNESFERRKQVIINSKEYKELENVVKKVKDKFKI